MEVKISELMDHYEDREFIPAEPGDVDAEAVRARVLARLDIPDQTAPAPAKRRRTRLIWALAAAAALLVCLATASATGWFSIDILGTIQKGNPNLNTAIVEKQIADGEWFSLEGNTMAVICPGSPASVIISRDKGNSWKEVVIEGSDDNWMAMRNSGYEEGIIWYGGFIDLHEDGAGLLVLASGVAMNSQNFCFYLTADGGDSWSAIPSVNEFHTSMMTGAGLAEDGTVCVGFQYYEDSGPDLWYSDDRGETWQRAVVERPEEYQGKQYRFTPRSPTFNGLEGALPVTVRNQDDSDHDIEIILYSHDGGKSWMPD